MSKAALDLAEDFSRRLKSYESGRKKVEQLLATGLVARSHANLFYEGVFLRSVTSFEGFVEDLFIGLASGRHSAHYSVVPRATFSSHSIAREIIFAGKSYVDWLPYFHTEKRAETFFRGGHPFSSLDKPERRELERILIIRNAIAHQSAYANSKFQMDVVGTLTLLPSERTPSGFLRSLVGVAPSRTRYEDIAGTLNQLARKLCTVKRASA
jgi:hypothetical protein